MVHRNKDFSSPPPALIDPKWDQLKLDLLSEKNAHKEKITCYRDTSIDSLLSLYENKCAACERKYGTELQVDHFRPKKKRDNKTKVEYNQPGYYWLCYEWSNLIPLCSKCNLFKSNKFPLFTCSENERVYSHTDDKPWPGFAPYDAPWLKAQENPLLINPELDSTPEQHFYFSPNGKMKSRTDYGKETIKIYKLNRKDLRRDRIELRQELVNSIESAFDDFVRSKDESELRGELKTTFKRLKIMTHESQPHSLFFTFVYRYFYHFITLKASSNIRLKLNHYFNAFVGS